MITAVDSNVLIDILADDGQFGTASTMALADSLRAGSVVACDVVWAETATGFAELDALHGVMERLGVAYGALERRSTEVASIAWRRYRTDGGARTRIGPDFLIGGHASVQADRLLTRDRGFYRRYYPDLEIVDPTPD